jgi:23S rRNA G2445 N2-methylase RlmL
MRAANRPRTPTARFLGRDRDADAIAISRANAERAGVSAWTDFTQAPVSEAAPPEGPPGLVIANPPYGMRLSEGRSLAPLHQALGTTLRARFRGWRAAILTTDQTTASVAPAGRRAVRGTAVSSTKVVMLAFQAPLRSRPFSLRQVTVRITASVR